VKGVQVTNISNHGIWTFVHDREAFLPFDLFPWFKDAPVGKILRVELVSENHLHWPDLDVDLDVESIFHPENYPLASGQHASN
jgi:hypothetical protein